MRRELTLRDFETAKTIANGFRGVSLSRIGRGDQLNLVGTCYRTVRGVPIEKLPEDQLFRIAERLYNQSHTIYGQSLEERKIADNILKMTKTDYNNLGELDERICIQLENYPEGHPLFELYKAAKNKISPQAAFRFS